MSVDPIILEIQAETRAINQKLDQLEGRVNKTEKSFKDTGRAGKKAFDETGKAADDSRKKVSRQEGAVNKLENGYKSLERRIIAAFAIERIASFTSEAISLAGELQGVEAAFNRISQPGLLRDLREATRGTVNDLELMKQAVRANNFQIPLEQMADLFSFARRRAKETGEEVDFLVNSIISGIGRKSPLILDNLGISAVRLRKELKGVGVESAGVGEIAEVVGRIAAEEMEKAGDEVETTKDRTDALKASFENVKIAIGQVLIPAVEDLLGALTSLQSEFQYIAEIGFWETLLKGYDPEQMNNLNKLNKRVEDLFIDIRKGINQVTDENFEEYWDQIGDRIDETIINTEEFNSLDEKIQRRLLERIDGETAVMRLKREEKTITEETLAANEAAKNAEREKVGIIKQLKDEIKGLNEALPDAQSQSEINRILEARNIKETELNAILNQRKNLLELEDATDPELDIPTFPSDPFGINETLPDSLKKAEKSFQEFYDNLLLMKAETDQQEVEWEQFKADQIAEIYRNRANAVGNFFGALNELMVASGQNSKELASFQALINAYLAISEALASKLDPVTKAIYVATITAQAFAQLASINAAQPPSFFKGTPFFSDSPSKGRRKDDGWARLHYGEAVIPSEANKRNKGLAKAWIDGKENDWIYTNHILPAIVSDRAERKAEADRTFASNIARSLSLNMPDERMFRELKRSRILTEVLVDEATKRQKKNPYRA